MISGETTLEHLLEVSKSLEAHNGRLQGICLFRDGTMRVFWAVRSASFQIVPENIVARQFGLNTPTAEEKRS